MRKTQENIIISAKKKKFPDVWCHCLEDESYSIEQLQLILSYFNMWHRSKVTERPTDEEIVNEIKRVFEMQHENIRKKAFLRRVGVYLLPGYRNDILFGSYRKNGIAGINYTGEKGEILNRYYMSMMADNRSWQTIRSIMRLVKGSEKSTVPVLDSKDILNEYEEKKEQSLLYYLIKNNIVLGYFEQKDLLKYMLDKNIWSKLDFSKLFRMDDGKSYGNATINRSYIREIVTDIYPLGRKLKNTYDFNKDGMCFIRSVDENILNELVKAVEITKTAITAKLPLYQTTIIMHDSGFINIKHTCYREMYIPADNGNHNAGADNQKKMHGFGASFRKEYKIIITPDMKFFQKTTKNKMFPLAVKTVLQLMNEGNEIRSLISCIFSVAAEKNPFFIDVYHDTKYGFVMPLAVNDIYQYHNRKQLMTERYKLAKDLNINWNKQDINLSYLIVKSMPYVQNEKSKQILLQQKNNALIDMVSSIHTRRYRDKVKRFLAGVLETRLESNIDDKAYNIVETGILDGESTHENENICWDYICMCFMPKSKIKTDLTIRSKKELKNKHDFVSYSVDYDQSTEAVNVPKDSKFNNLRKMLPDTFEWIRSRKRLIMETQLQHHCVWSYAKKITNDHCAIYSFIDRDGIFQQDGTPKRYTVEFMIKDGKYYVEQTQGRYDAVNTSIMRGYIEGLIEEKK